MIRVGVCGFGYWGPRLVRAFLSNPSFRVVAVADAKSIAQDRARELGPSVHVYSEAEELIDSFDIDAVVIATPVITHFPLALRALQRGKHVLVEKPMCASASEGRELVAVADRTKRTLMVDHTYLFHGAVDKLKELKASGALGEITYYDSLRVNLGLFQPDMNVLWDLAPHDFSIMNYILEEQPVWIEATGYCHVNPNLPDIVYITLHYASRVIAHLNLSWMSPVKARRIAFGGTRQMVVWNDLDPDETLKVYNSGIEFRSEDERNIFIPGYRIGDIHSPRLGRVEPLSNVVQHFYRAIAGEQSLLADGRAGLRVVDLLERTQRVLDQSLAKIASLHVPTVAPAQIAG
jgi:predicted dehydrogenase